MIDIKKFLQGIKLLPTSTPTTSSSSTKGLLEVTTVGKLNYHNGTSSSPVVTEDQAATLTNKILTAPVINSPTGIVKGDVGLSAVDNTSDATKNAAPVVLTNKTISGANNTITNIPTSALPLNIDAANIADGSVSNAEFQTLDATSSIQTQINSKVNKAGDSMTGNLAMGTNLVIGVGTPVNSTDAVNKAYVDTFVAGIVWLSPLADPDLIDDSLSAPPGSPLINTVYLIGAAPSGLWAGLAGHVVYWDGVSSWVDVLGRAVVVGDRFGITFESGSGFEGGNMSGQHNTVAQVTNATPGSFAYTFSTTTSGHAVYINEPLSEHFGHSYTFNGTSWLEFGAPSPIVAGVGLSLSTGILNVNLGAGIQQLPSDEVGVDAHANGGLFTTIDNSTIDTSTNAQLAVKIDGGTLSKSAGGIKVASGSLSDTQIAANGITGASFRLNNNQDFRAKNFAGADVSILRLDTSDVINLGNGTNILTTSSLVPVGTKSLGSTANPWDIISVNTTRINASIQNLTGTSTFWERSTNVWSASDNSPSVDFNLRKLKAGNSTIYSSTADNSAVNTVAGALHLIGFNWITTSAFNISSLTYSLNKGGSVLSGNIVARIYSDFGGIPNVLLATSTALPVSVVTGVVQDITFSFSPTLALSNATKYHFILDCSGVSGAIDINFHRYSYDADANQHYEYSLGGIGGTWSVGVEDAYAIITGAGGVKLDWSGLALNVTGVANFLAGEPIRMHSPDAGSYVGLKTANGSTSGDFILPATDGTAGQVLRTNGARVLSWASSTSTSGTYTPTLSSSSGLSSLSTSVFQYLQVGNVVTVSGKISAQAVSNINVSCSFNMTLPVAPTSFTDTAQASGSAISTSPGLATASIAAMSAVTSSSLVQFLGKATSTVALEDYYVHFTYRV